MHCHAPKVQPVAGVGPSSCHARVLMLMLDTRQWWEELTWPGMNGQLAIANSDSLGLMVLGALVDAWCVDEMEIFADASINPNQTQGGAWHAFQYLNFMFHIQLLVENPAWRLGNFMRRLEVSGCNEIYSDTTVMPYDQWVMTGFTFSKAGVVGWSGLCLSMPLRFQKSGTNIRNQWYQMISAHFKMCDLKNSDTWTYQDLHPNLSKVA